MSDQKTYLPLGSIVRLKNGKKKVMISGFCLTASNGKLYDYCGYLYPEGVIVNNKIGMFDHDQIEEVIFIGYDRDLEEKLGLGLLTDLGFPCSPRTYNPSPSTNGLFH